MRCTAETIARQANREDGCTGRFWEGRYRAQLILDEISLLACAVYVDLNPIRAALARTPEESQCTGAKDRIDDLKQRQGEANSQQTHAWERNGPSQQSGWMSPIEIDERADPLGADASPCGRRASQKGFLSLSLSKYLELLDWTGRQLRSGKRGAIPATLAPILERVRLDEENWCALVRKFGRLFKRAAGSPETLAREAARRGQTWLQSPASSLFARSTN